MVYPAPLDLSASPLLSCFRVRFFTELLEGLRIAMQAGWANKLRALLTTLGIIIGMEGEPR